MKSIAILSAMAAMTHSAARSSLADDMRAGFFDGILAGEPPSFAYELTMPPAVDYEPLGYLTGNWSSAPRYGRSRKIGTSEKGRSKDARKARRITRQSKKR